MGLTGSLHLLQIDESSGSDGNLSIPGPLETMLYQHLRLCHITVSKRTTLMDHISSPQKKTPSHLYLVLLLKNFSTIEIDGIPTIPDENSYISIATQFFTLIS